MQTYLYVIVINNKRQGHLFQNIEGSRGVDLLATYRLVDLQSDISYKARNEGLYGLDVALYCIINIVATR